ARGRSTMAIASKTERRSTTSVNPTAVLHRPRPFSTAASILSLETGDVREQRQIARTLDRGPDLPLMPSAHPADPPWEDLASLGDVAAEAALVLVIDRPKAR